MLFHKNMGLYDKRRLNKEWIDYILHNFMWCFDFHFHLHLLGFWKDAHNSCFIFKVWFLCQRMQGETLFIIKQKNLRSRLVESGYKTARDAPKPLSDNNMKWGKQEKVEM